MPEDNPIKIIAAQFDLLVLTNDFEANKKELATRINDLIEHDFQKLISLLYRLDVSEEKLKRLLMENKDQDAGIIIADLVIERQVQKMKSRQQFSQRDSDIDEDEKW